MEGLLDHQRTGIEFLCANPRAALFDEPGLGKSRQAIEAAEGPTLIVAPSMIIDGGVWDDELEKWGYESPVPQPYTQVPYSQLCAFEKSGRGHKPTGKLKPELKQHWGTVIVDECHYLKNRKAYWTTAFSGLRYDRLILLTGTPIPNWAHEAFSLLKLLWPEESKPGMRYGSYWRWVQEWFDVGQLRGKGGRVITEWHIGDLRRDRTWDDFRAANWGDRTLLRLRKDCLDLPPLTEQQVKVKLKGEQARVYKDLKKDFVAWMDSGEEITAWNDAAQYVKLWQCATALPNGKGAKMDALRELIQDRELPTLVVAHFRHSVHSALEVCAEAKKNAAVITGATSAKQRGEFVRAFQGGNLDVLCATIDTISEGLTLNAADQVIRLERSPRPSRNVQVRDRIYRIGQDKPVTCIDLVGEGTIDEGILKLLGEKTDQQAKALPRAALRAAA